MEVNQLKLETLIANKEYLDNQTFITVIGDYCKKNASYKLLDLVLKYLENYPHQISLISKRLFTHLLSTTEQQLHPLVLFLASRHNDIGYDVDLDNLPVEKWSYLMSAFYQRLPLMICDPKFVENIKKKIDTYTMLMDSPQWFNENGDLFMGLHSIEFDENECEELFVKLEANWSIFKITKAAVTFVDLVASKCNKELEFIQFLIIALFSLPPKNNDVTWLSNQILNNFKLLETNNCSIKINDWEAFIIKAIKCGLIEENPVYDFIKVLRILIKKANVDKSVVLKSFELLTGYSQFTSIMLSRNAKELQKEIVLKLIETLVKKEPSIMALSHVPLFLCSYNASLSVTDQILLRILFFYENNGIPMSNYRPYLWGSFAVSHYQVKSHLISKTLNSFPSTTEVLSYVPLKRLKETISNFPINRILFVKNQKIIRFNDCSDPNKMFDPSFFLPMISSLLGTEAPLSIEKFNTNGCLSMTLACLASNDSSMRLAAYHVLKLLRSHLFCRRAENIFWDHFISWVKHGLQDLHLRPPPRLSMIQALFLSRMVLAIANHENGLEKTCCKILMARPIAELNHIPELKMFFNSYAGIDQALHVHWFLCIIRDGMRSKSDWKVLKNMDLLNKFLTFYSFSSQKNRKTILKIMNATFRVQPATNGGTGPWALNLMTAISKCVQEVSTEEVHLIFECLESLSNNVCISTPVIDFWLYMFLDYGNNSITCVKGLNTLTNLVSKYKEIFKSFEEDDLKDILRCIENSKAVSDKEVFRCQMVLKHGTYGIKIENPEEYLFLPVLVKILKLKDK